MGTRGQRRLIFATREDWIPVLSTLEEIQHIKYIESGMLLNSEPKEYSTFRRLPGFGEAVYGDAIQEPRYLIMNNGSPVASRRVRLDTGEVRYVVDHENNPTSVIFSAGGVLQVAKAVVSGEVSRVSTLAAAEDIFQALTRLIKKHFRNVRVYWVGSNALALSAIGYRLTGNIQSPIEYDLHY
jgi:hypothetical protein